MHLLILGMNYAPEKTGIGVLTADMCEYLAAKGHRVHMVTGFPHFPEWRVYDGYRGKLLSREHLNGVELRRGFVYVPGKPKTAQRIIYDTSIAISSAINLIGNDRPDVVLVLSPPLQLVVTAIAAGKLWRRPVLLVVKDIVPDVAIGAGMLKNPLALRLAFALEHSCYRHADHLSVISEGFVRNLVSKGVQRKRISLIPDWVDLNVVRPLPRSGRFREKHGIDPSTFVALLAGNMSPKMGLENILMAADCLREKSNIQFVMVGEGSAKSGLQAMARKLNLSNVTFLPFEPEEMLPDMLASADALLLNQRGDVREAVLPSKFLKYMAAGGPVLAAVNSKSETAIYIRDANCGEVVPPENPAALATATLGLSGDERLREEMGKNGRAFAEKHFSREQVLAAYESLLYRLAEDGHRVLLDPSSAPS